MYRGRDIRKLIKKELFKEKLGEEQGSFTVEATIICLFIIIITMTIIMNVMKIYDNAIINREKECKRYAIEAFISDYIVK